MNKDKKIEILEDVLFELEEEILEELSTMRNEKDKIKNKEKLENIKYLEKLATDVEKLKDEIEEEK